MVKNYLVGSVRPVIKTWYSDTPAGATVDNRNREQHLALYKEMYATSRASARKFLAGEWEEILHSAPCLDARMFQIAQWYLVKELWFREPCNILCMGADTMFIKPTEVFGRWNTMRLFNYTDPRNHPEFTNYFNDDVRYFPHDMDPAIWELGERRMAEWFSHQQAHWDLGQLINNTMFWNQSIDDNDRLHPYMNWMSHNLRDLSPESLAATHRWNRFPFESVHVMHFNGSRGPAATLDIMKLTAEKFGVDV